MPCGKDRFARLLNGLSVWRTTGESESEMQVIEVAENGGPEALRLVEKPTPWPAAGQVLIEVKAAGINFADMLARQGVYPPAPKPPFVPGFEVAGIVASLGEGVSVLTVGQRVMGSVSWAGYADYAILDAHAAIPLPDTLDFAPATALLVQGLTAWFLLDAAHFQPGESVLVNAAAGGVGSLAAQIARLRGASVVIGTASTEDKRNLIIRDFGATAAVDYTSPGWAQKVIAANDGKKVNVFLDATGELAGEGYDTLADGGRWLFYGSQQGRADDLPAQRALGLLFRNQSLTGFSLYPWMSDAARLQNALSTLIQWATEGQLKIIATERFPLADAARAHEAIASRKTVGKVVLEP
jgi:NADPH2:quinone reductase